MRMITFHLIFPLKKQPSRKLRTISHFSVLPTSLDHCRIGRPSFVFSVLLLSLSFSQRSPYLFSCPTPTCFLGSTNLCSCFQVLPALIIPSHSDSFVRRVMAGKLQCASHCTRSALGLSRKQDRQGLCQGDYVLLGACDWWMGAVCTCANEALSLNQAVLVEAAGCETSVECVPWGI